MKMPPAPVPTHRNAPASATTERSVPSDSWIGFMPTTMSRDEPNDTDRIAKINQAVRHEALLSTLAGRVAPPPGSGPSILFSSLRACLPVCAHYHDNRALLECDWLPLCATFARFDP
ncbi:MAG: hypothetical protein HYX38_19495 [Rhodospirillales bacterium]|nr:hypothetical protein [Rhodospirillales bacterium]